MSVTSSPSSSPLVDETALEALRGLLQSALTGCFTKAGWTGDIMGDTDEGAKGRKLICLNQLLSRGLVVLLKLMLMA